MSAVKSALSRSFPLLLGLLAAGALISPIGHARAASAAPFEGLSGKWAGEGSIALTNGTTERLRCDASYAVGGGGATLDQNLKCASDSYKFDLRVSLEDKGGAIVGNFNELNNNVQGGISGQESKGLIRVQANAQSFTADVSVATHGSTQSVKIRSASGNLSLVNITLRRAR
jgi:hypothetical protein